MHSSRYTNYIMHTCCKSIIDVTYNIFSQTQVIHNTHTHTQNIHAQVGLVYMRIQVQTTVKFTARVQLCTGQAKARKTKCDDNHYREDAVGRLFYEGRTAEINERQLWLNRRNPRVHHHLPTSVT